jgi:lipid A ethanolaminephosphotransferase
MLKNNIKLKYFVLIASFVNFLLFHLPFFKFVFNNLDYKSLNGITIIISLVVAMLVVNAFVLYLIFFLSQSVGKFLLILFFIISSIAVYFINTYNVIIDKTMIGNILNTRYEESSSFFSSGLIMYLILFGIIPVIFIIKVKIIKVTVKKFLINFSLTLLFILSLVYLNSSNWLWIDKNSTKLGALAMPWSYMVNTSRYYIHKNQENKKEILLPNATIKDSEKSIAVLVIGESARSENFSLYGYEKPTNPLLSKIENVYSFNASSCATYTTAGVKCILEHKNTSKLYEILPNYLYRNNVEVIWRTTNWGEPPIHIKNIFNKNDLKKGCDGEECNYDEILLNGLKEQISASKKDKILIILHTSTSHGPTYNKKYPPKFEKFKPVCESVELGKCTPEELMNAYDNTIVYTDYILSSLINTLKQLKEYNSTMLFVSDHGESLGENNLYMHGIPASIAPKEQLEIPFIVWLSDNSKKLKPNETLSQNHVFHSVLNFLAIESPIYDENMNIFQ